MSEAGLHPFETILRLCAAAAPEPWYPRLFAQQEGVNRKALGQCLEELWLSGLIERADGGPEKGPAIALTREGQRVLLDPEALERLRAGKPVSVNDRGAIVRQALSGRIRPTVTRILVVINVLVFVAGYYAARQVGAGSEFLSGSPIVTEILHKSGAVTPADMIEGEWWRLLTAGFVHIGLMHILMNMTGLFVAGRFIEQMWGHLRYLVIYLVGLLGGSCLGMVHPPDLLAGASGAICGLLAAEGVWFLFNRRYLPRGLLRQARTNFVINLVLLIFISSFKNVSGWGHFGGAVAGGLAAMLLQLHRFGPPLWRWLAIAGFAPMLWYAQFAIQHARATDPRWQQFEREVVQKRFAKPVAKALAQAKQVYKETALPLLEKHPTRREAAKVGTAVAELEQQRDKLRALDEKLIRFGPLYSPLAANKSKRYHDRIAARLALIELAAKALHDGEKWPASATIEQRDFETQYLRATDATVSEAMAVYRQRIRPLFETEPARRDTTAITDARNAVMEQRPELAELVEELKAARAYDDETAEEARQKAEDYATGCQVLFNLALQGLNAEEKGNDVPKEAISRQEKKVDRLYQEWRDLVE
jgi:rhomboid protease GluP